MSGQRGGTPRSSLDRYVAGLERAGVRFTHRGDHVQAECPTHTDEHPSLSGDYLPSDGQVVFRCQADCGSNDVLAALELTWPMLYDDYEEPDAFAERRAQERAEDRASGRGASHRRRSSRSRKPSSTSAAAAAVRSAPALPKGRLPARLTEVRPQPVGEWSVTTTYDYCDAGATVVHQEVRHERPVEVVDHETGEVSTRTEKRFTQRWPDNRGGWVEKTPTGFVPVLYRLPDLAGWIAEGRRVWLCEGGKDAERLLELGEAATTNPSGATNFKAEQADALAGAHVVAVLDQDLAGYRRARRLDGLLAGKVASLRFALPRTEALHSDASDHLDAGYALADLVEVDVERLALLEHTAEAEAAATAATPTPAEAAARRERATQAPTKAKAADEQRFAARWAAEAGKQLVRATGALEAAVQRGPVSEDLQQRLVAAVTACQAAVIDAHGAAGVPVPAELGEYLEAPTAAGARGHATGAGDELAAGAGDVDDNVIEHPTSSRLPEPTQRIPMARGLWAYEEGGEVRRPRGVYMGTDGRWDRVAPLPYIKARIVRRDGTGRRTGTVFLISATVDGPGVIIGPDELRASTWANSLGLSLSHDDRIQRAAATAIIYAAEHAEEREATPRVTDEGRIALPVPDTLPGSYLEVAPVERDEALSAWREIALLAARSPRMALVLGATAIAPYVAALGRQSHIVALYGDSDRGKSVTMHTAGAIWGDSVGRGANVVRPWNTSGIGVTRYLGQLGVLPPFLDEAGQASMSGPREWGKLIYDICEGAQRMTAEMRGLGVRVTMPWDGILISAGNGRITDGLGAGKFAGVGKRVIDVETPLTLDAEHAEAFKPLVEKAFGHLGHEILERHSAETVRPLIDRAAEDLGMPEGGNERTVARHLHAHLAGARIIDQIAGTGGQLYAAALEACATYLQEWTTPQHDADRILEAVLDAIGREPAMWPSVEAYVEHQRPKVEWGSPDAESYGSPRLPQHGVNKTLSGIQGNTEAGGRWVAVFAHTWRLLCEELGADSAVACRELAARNLLRRTDSARRRNEWTCQIKATGTKMYQLCLPEDPDELPESQRGAAPDRIPDSAPSEGQVDADVAPPASEPTPATLLDVDLADAGLDEAPVAGPAGPGCGSVAGEVAGTNVPLTCEVAGVAGVAGEISRIGAGAYKSPPGPPSEPPREAPEHTRLDPDDRRPCVVCGTLAGQLVGGRAVHLGPCLDRLDDCPPDDRTDNAAPTQAPATAPTSSEQTADLPPSAPAAASPTEAPSTAADRRRERPARFSAPAACLDHDGLHLADGTVRPWPELVHLGELAALTGRDQLRLGWGGGEDRLPDPGQIWLYPAALERLGLPTEIPLPEEFMTKAQRAKHLEKLFGRLDDHPLVAGAREAGWQFGQGGHLATWTRIWHPELLPGGAFLVGLPWHHLDGVPLYNDDPAPGVLARRLLLFAQHVGIAFRLTPTATGLDLIDHHRPPRRDVDDDRGSGRRRVALVRGVGAELPPWCSKPGDARFATLEQDFSWWRPWDTVPASEQDRRYVHGYDRNASYLVPWRGIELGVEQLQHRTGDAASWDGRERPGYYLVDKWEWGSWGLPDPGGAAGAPVGNGKVWVTVHTLRQLSAHGIHPTVHETYTWDVTSRYLEGPGKALADARTSLSTATAADAGPDAAAVLATVKLLYAATVGKLAEREHRPDFHLWRPDWRDHVIAATRTAILHTITKAAELSNEHPLVVDRDAVFYASNDPDPTTAWPGDPAKLSPALGAWKPIGTGDLADWGPAHLTKRTGRWRYADALDALTRTEKP